MLDLGSFLFLFLFCVPVYFSQMCIQYVCTSHTSLHGVYLYVCTTHTSLHGCVHLVCWYHTSLHSVRLYHTYYRFYSADVYMVCLYLIHMGIIPHSICVLHLFPQVGRGPSLCPCDFNSASFAVLDLVFFR